MNEAISLIPIGPQKFQETSGQERTYKEVMGADKFVEDFQTFLDLDEVEYSKRESGQPKEVQALNDDVDEEEGAKGLFLDEDDGLGENTVQLLNDNVTKDSDVENYFLGVKVGVKEGTGQLRNNDKLKGADLENQSGWNIGSLVLGQGEENGDMVMQQNNILGGLKAILDQKTDGSDQDIEISDGVAKALIKGAAKTTTGENDPAMTQTENTNSILLEGENSLMDMTRMNDPLNAEKGISLVKGSNVDARLLDLPAIESPLGVSDSGDVRDLASHKIKEVLSFSSGKGFSQYLVEDVGNRVGLSIRGGIGKATISLNPPALGHLKIDILVKDDIVKAVIGAENSMVKEILEKNLQGLKDALSRQDLMIDELVVLLNDRPAGGEEGFGSREGFADKDWNAHGTPARIGEITKDVPSLLNLRKGAVDLFI